MFQIRRKIERWCNEHRLKLENIEQIGTSTFYVDVITSGFFAVKQTWKLNFCRDDLRAMLDERAAR